MPKINSIKQVDTFFSKFSKVLDIEPLSTEFKVANPFAGLELDATIKVDSTAVAKDIDEAIKPEALEIAADIMRQATLELVEPLTTALNAALDASWGWEGGSRDIVDTGALKQSLSITVNGDNKLTVNYSSPYASLIHYGGYIMPYGNGSIARVYIPGRPWVEAVMQGGGPVPQFDFLGHYSKYFPG